MCLEFDLFPPVSNVLWLVLDECDNVCERQLCQHLVEIDCGMAELSSFTCGLFFFFSTNCQHFTGSLTHCKISLKSFHIAGNTGCWKVGIIKCFGRFHKQLRGAESIWCFLPNSNQNE